MNKRIVMLAAAAWFLLSCATPERTISLTTWSATGTMLSHGAAQESGLQLWVGERHEALAGNGAMLTSDISRAQLGAVALGAIGAAAGAYAGGVPGMVLGAGGGALAGAMMDRDGKTTSTAAMLAPAMAGKTAALRPAPLPSTATDPSVAAAWLKSYLRSNPEACRLIPIIGQDGVDSLIDQLIGGVK